MIYSTAQYVKDGFHLQNSPRFLEVSLEGDDTLLMIFVFGFKFFGSVYSTDPKPQVTVLVVVGLG